MSRIRSKDTLPEKKVRSMVYRMGYSFRLYAQNLPRKPDLVFPGRKKVIFVHGCFWHQHPRCKKSAYPKSKKDYWIPKLLANRARDLRVARELKGLGWKILVIWQCQIAREAYIAKKLIKFLDSD